METDWEQNFCTFCIGLIDTATMIWIWISTFIGKLPARPSKRNTYWVKMIMATSYKLIFLTLSDIFFSYFCGIYIKFMYYLRRLIQVLKVVFLYYTFSNVSVPPGHSFRSTNATPMWGKHAQLWATIPTKEKWSDCKTFTTLISIQLKIPSNWARLGQSLPTEVITWGFVLSLVGKTILIISVKLG